MDLQLDILGSYRGRPAKPVEPLIVRALREEDLALLGTEVGVKAVPLKALRAKHHSLARLLAQGSSPADCAVITGYALSRISILQGDPTFRELVEFYRAEVEDAYLDMHAKLAAAGNDALEILSERMTEDPDSIKTSELIEVIKTTADRTGHGPSSTTKQEVTVNFASRLEEARKRLASRTIDVTPNE